MLAGLFGEGLFVKQLRVGMEGEWGLPLCHTAHPTELDKPTWPLYLPISFSRKHPSKQKLYFKGRNKEMKDVDFEWKANGWFFHLKLILFLSSILIVNWWKLFLSVVNGKRNEGEKRGVFSLSCLFLDSSVLSSIKHNSQIKILVCSECIQLFQMSNIQMFCICT